MKAIVTGITGQDGYYMAQLLLREGIHVVGLTRDPESSRKQFPVSQFEGLEFVRFEYDKSGAFEKVFQKYTPALIFNFAAKATGVGMFDNPSEMTRLNGTFVLDILEALRNSPDPERTSFCQASSSEMFGNVQVSQQDESTPFLPKSPYGAAKLYAHNMVGIYRATYGVRCCSAILYNLCEVAFDCVGLNYSDYVRVDTNSVRASPSISLYGNPSRISNELGWQADFTIEQIMTEMVLHELSTQSIPTNLQLGRSYCLRVVASLLPISTTISPGLSRPYCLILSTLLRK